MEIRAKTGSQKKIETFLEGFLKLGGLSILRPTTTEIADAIDSMGKRRLDFDDSLVVSCMLANRIRKLISFDRHFDRVNGVERAEPIYVMRTL